MKNIVKVSEKVTVCEKKKIVNKSIKKLKNKYTMRMDKILFSDIKEILIIIDSLEEYIIYYLDEFIVEEGKNVPAEHFVFKVMELISSNSNICVDPEHKWDLFKYICYTCMLVYLHELDKLKELDNNLKKLKKL